MGKGCRMNQSKKTKSLTEVFYQGLQEAQQREMKLGGLRSYCHDDLYHNCMWATACARDFIANKLTPVMLQSKNQPEMKTALRTFAQELGLGARFEMEEMKSE